MCGNIAVRSSVMVNIRSHVGCNRQVIDIAGLYRPIFHILSSEDTCLHKVCNIRSLSYRKNFRNLKQLIVFFESVFNFVCFVCFTHTGLRMKLPPFLSSWNK